VVAFVDKLWAESATLFRWCWLTRVSPSNHSDSIKPRAWGGAADKKVGGHTTLVGFVTPLQKLALVASPPVFIIPEKGVVPTDLYWKAGTSTKVPVPFMVSPSGWMTSELWYEYAVWFCEKLRVDAQIVGAFVLFIDCCAAHLSLKAVTHFRNKDVFVITLPSNATHLLQPLDVQIFGAFAPRLQRATKRYINNEFQGDLMRHKADLSAIIRLCQGPWEHSTTPLNVANGFSKCGLAPIDLDRIDDLLQVSARENDRIEVEEQPFDVPDVPSLRAAFGDIGEASAEGKSSFSFASFADPVRGPTLKRALELFFFVNRGRLLEPYLNFGAELLSRAEAADYGGEGYERGSLELPPRLVLGPVHTPRPKPGKVTANVFAEMGARLMTSDDVVKHLTERQAKEAAKAKEKEERKNARTSARAKRAAEAATAAQERAAVLASEGELRAYAQSQGIKVHDHKKLARSQLASILKSLDPEAARTGSRAALMAACVAALPAASEDVS